MKPVLTILTNSVPPRKNYARKGARFFKRLILGKRPLFDSYEGHPAVTRSLLEGLRGIDFFFNYNPKEVTELASTILVLNDLKALHQAIDFKKEGKITRLYAGPMFDIDSERKEGLNSPHLDCFLVNNPFTLNWCIQEIPELRGRCRIWPAGVNLNEWKPLGKNKEKKVLFYDKLDHGQSIPSYQKFLFEKGWNSSILRYGYYTKKRFLQELGDSQVAIFFSPSESQGIALLESWAADVPTLVWNRGWASASRGRRPPASSAPYLNDRVGAFFTDFVNFQEVFQSWEEKRLSLYPRQWVGENMTDEISVKKLLEILSF